MARASNHLKMAPPPYDDTGIVYLKIASFTFSTGETLPIRLAYRSYKPSAESTVLIPTCYRGRINSTLSFTDSILRDRHVIVIAMLGNGESSSPSNTPFFPKKLEYEDQINAQYALLQHLKIRELEAVIGFSMGGQQAFYWAAMHGTSPEPFVKNVVSICSSAKTSPHNIAFLEGPITALSASIDYESGEYKAKNIVPVKGLHAFAQAYAAWLTSAEWFQQELWTNWGQKSLEQWLNFVAEGYEDWDAEDLLILARQWQAGDVGKVSGNGNWKQALKDVKAKVLVMPSRTDQYFTPSQSEKEVECLEKGELAVIETIWGHVAGGGGNPADTKWMEEKIGTFLSI